MHRRTSKPANRLVAFSIVAMVSVLSHTAVAQDFDLGPIPDVVIDCLATSATAGSLRPDANLDGSWLQFRRDRKLTGRSPLIGDITCPEVLWTIDLGARKHWISVTPGSSSSTIELPLSGESGNHWSLRSEFEFDGRQVELPGSTSGPQDPLGRGITNIGDHIASLAGLERIICYPDFGNVENRCYLQNWANSQWNTVWSSELSHFDNNAGGSRPIVGDFDNDGEIETAVVAWYQFHVLELETGQLEVSGEFLDPQLQTDATGRAYGWFGAKDLGDDARLEFVILGDFEHFLAVFGWDNTGLVELWNHRIQEGNYETTVRHHVIPNPVADVDGDGLAEIVTSIFNENGDEKWHVVVFDGLSGAIELDLADSYLSGLGDLDGDQVAELLVSDTSGSGVPKFGNIRVISFDGQTLSTLWSAQNEEFAVYGAPGFPDVANPGTTFHRRDAFLRNDWGAQPVFATRARGASEPDITLRFYSSDGNGIAQIGSMTGPRLTILSMPESTPERGVLVQSITETASEGSLSLTNLSGVLELTGRIDSNDGQPFELGRYPLLSASVVGPIDSARPNAVITQDYAQTIRAFDVSNGTSSLELWRATGRGLFSGAYDRPISSVNEFRSVILADVDGGGDFEVIMADRASDGDGLISAVDGDGTTVWQAPLPADGSPPAWNNSGITHWVAGNFRDDGHEDVLVSIRRQTQHNHELHLVDGSTGQVVWELTNGGVLDCFAAPITGPGDSLMPVLDWDGDGLDEALNVGSNLFAVYDGVTGSLLTQRPLLDPSDCPLLNPIGGISSDAPAITPIADFLNNGSEQILFGKNERNLGILALAGDPIWLTPENSGMPFNTLQGIADLDGNGDLELVVVGHCAVAGEEIHTYDAASGDLEWSMPMPEACDGTAVNWPGAKALSSGDLDGDGRDEVYFTQGNVLYALAEIGGNGTWLWRATFAPYYNEFSTAVIADVDGTGRPQILINHPDGYLFGLGNPFFDNDGDGIDDDVDPDDDGDTMPDSYELANGLDPLDPSDADEDADGDGFTNLVEFRRGTDPQDALDFPPPKRAPVAIFLLLDDDDD